MLDSNPMSEPARFRKGFLITLVIGVSVAFFYVVSDFLLTAFMAAIFAGLARPLYLRLLNAFGGRRPAASIVTLLIIITLIGAPLAFVLTIVTNQAIELTSAVTPWVWTRSTSVPLSASTEASSWALRPGSQ